MIEQNNKSKQNGFTLFELLAVVMVLSILTFISVNMFNSVKARNHLTETDDRLTLIAAKLKQYYALHETLPAPVDPDGLGPEPEDDVPVGVDALDLEQRYRLDAWGHYIRYLDASAINVLSIDGSSSGVAGVIVSLGPNQIQDYTVDDPDNPTTFTSGGDDVHVSIDVAAEAKAITLRELKNIQEQVAAYDALFPGIDNDGDGEVDEVSDVGSGAILTIRGAPPSRDYNTCPPANSFSNDPSGGFPTLDAIESGTIDVVTGEGDYNCPAPLINHFVDFYELPNSLLLDSWNQLYQWGYSGKLLEDGSSINTTDRRYHRFYSTGPSGSDAADDSIIDDLIYSGQ